MQQLSPRGQGFDQTEQDPLTSKQRDKYRQTNLYFQIPQAKPLLSKFYIDNSKPKILMKEIKMMRQPTYLSTSSISPQAIDKLYPGRRQQQKMAQTTLWKRFIVSNNYKFVYIKYLNATASDNNPKNSKKIKHQLLKLTQNRQYLFATYILDMNFLTDGATTSILRNLEQTTLQQIQNYITAFPLEYQFDSRFECGNLMYALEKSEGESIIKDYYLILQNDINTKGYANWFYFKFISKNKGKYRFHFVNLQKNYSFFGCGMKPAIFSHQKFLNNKTQWHYDGSSLSYHKNQLHKEQSNKIRYNSLSFTYEQLYDNDIIYFASGVPYSYSKLISFIDFAEKIAKHNNNLYFRKEVLACSLSSNQCPLLTITYKRDKKKEEPKSKKKIVLILARQHPTEVVSSYVVEGIISQLLREGESTVQLLKRYIFKIIPMVNIDGVIYGNSRCDITGSDPNRKWTKNSNQFLYPILTAIKKLISNLIFQGYEIQYFIDLHGHSRKLGTFIYACKQYEQVESRMFSWIMSKISDKFSYENCRFGISNFRKETARGFMMNIASNRKSMTVQTSFFGYKSENGMKAFDQNDLHQIGESLIEGIHIDTFRNSKAINWATVKNDIKVTISKKNNQDEDEEESGSDSNPEIDQLTIKQKLETFLSPANAGKVGLIDIKVVEKNKFENADNSQQSNHEIFDQNYDTILNRKYLQSQTLAKVQKLNAMKSSKSVTKLQPFRFKSLQKKSLSLNKKIQIAIQIERIDKKQQRLSTPTLPTVITNGKSFWQNLKKEYDHLLNQKKSIIVTQDLRAKTLRNKY